MSSADAPSPEASRRLRLFLALELPRPARSALVGWRERALGGRAELRLIPPDALHVTIVFLGGRDRERLDEITEVAFAAAASAVSAPPRLRPLAVRPIPARRPRLYALELEDESGRAALLQRAVGGALAEAGLWEPERRPFWPHLTIARVRSRSARRGARERAGEPALPPLPSEPPPQLAFEAAELVLYRSLLAPSGARYEPLARCAVGVTSS